MISGPGPPAQKGFRYPTQISDRWFIQLTDHILVTRYCIEFFLNLLVNFRCYKRLKDIKAFKKQLTYKTLSCLSLTGVFVFYYYFLAENKKLSMEALNIFFIPLNILLLPFYLFGFRKD